MLPGAQMKLVGADAGHYEHEDFVEEVLLAPSERVIVDVLFADAGKLEFEHRTPERTYTLATVDVAGDPAPALAPPERLSEPSQRFPALRGPTRRFVFDITSTKANTYFEINDDVFDEAIADATPTLGTTERWVIYNKSGEWHPFHIHQDDFKVVKSSPGGQPQLQGDHDVVGLPPGTPAKPSVTEIEMPFTDFEGNFVFHCHILDHEDAGMMSLVELRKSR
jgi:FtsP/CotA-like multicopper oxidase with cupredoxin domain